MRQELDSGTWLDREELAYCTRNGGPCGSGRKARAICADGKARTFTAGIPDTYFSIPAIGRIAGKYVRGYLTIEDSGQAGTLVFHASR